MLLMNAERKRKRGSKGARAENMAVYNKANPDMA
jgi:hypothetical protein